MTSVAFTVAFGASSSPASAQVALSLPVHAVDPIAESVRLIEREQIRAGHSVSWALELAHERAAEARKAAAAESRRPKYARPTQGAFTSGFGARWGTVHNGVDIANAIGTPILSAADGVVIEAGPASGFGLWVRVRHDDGTITVYGHVNEILAHTGQLVRAGDQIATMGNGGQSTGPHLHFEVWRGDARKIDPVGWLAEHGVTI